MKPGRTRRLAKLAAWLLMACGAFVFLAVPVHRYNWMHQMDSSLRVPTDAGLGNSTILVMLLLAAIVISQFAIFATAKTRRERTVAIALATVAIVLALSRLLR